jgi:hypothetical protein
MASYMMGRRDEAKAALERALASGQDSPAKKKRNAGSRFSRVAEVARSRRSTAPR